MINRTTAEDVYQGNLLFIVLPQKGL